MNLRKSGIEYFDYTWTPVRGCHHTLAECAIAERCWARRAAGMGRSGNRDFSYSEDRAELDRTFPRKPSIIGVCFTGDLMGPWVSKLTITFVKSKILQAPQHQFLLLTKNPARYADFSPWPSNAWLGASITGAESEDVQAQRAAALREATRQGGHPWVSYEPALGELLAPEPFAGIEWVVVGGLSGQKPDRGILDRCGRAANYAQDRGIPVWVKSKVWIPRAASLLGWQQRPRGLTL